MNRNNHQRHGLRARVLLLLLGTGMGFESSGCSTTRGPLAKVQEQAANLFLPPTQEAKLGEQVAAEIEQQYPKHPSMKLQRAIRDLGRSLTAQAADTPKGIEYTFTVLDAPDTINAFAIPGGHVYVLTGLIKAADDEAELAGVLAHEISHVSQRHVAERLVAAFGLQAIAAAALGESPGLIATLAAQIAGQGFLLKYSRDQERQADSVGAGYMRKAGWDPSGMVSFFQKLLDEPQPPVFLSSHPLPEERVENLEAQISKMGRVPQRRDTQGLQRLKELL